jgi:E3 ubiquitin-protein ligase HUWE1
MIGMRVNYHDLEAFDPEYYKTLNLILSHSLVDIGLDDMTFSAESIVFGQVQEIDLVDNGSNITVTDQNKIEYVKLIANHRMTSSIRKQV